MRRAARWAPSPRMRRDEYQFTREQHGRLCDREPAPRQRGDRQSAGSRRKSSPVTVVSRKGEVTVDVDEQPGKGNPDKIPQLRAAFAKDGTITAATSSSISDGAAALVLTRQSVADKLGKTPVARVVAHCRARAGAGEVHLGPGAGASQKVLDKAGWSVDDVDLFEVNEAFACVAMIAMRDLGIPHDKINVNGGATALGHPIGASGARDHDDADRRARRTAASSAASRACASAAAKRPRSRWSWSSQPVVSLSFR